MKVLYFLLDLPGSEPLVPLESLLARMVGAWSCFELVQVRAKEAGARDYACALHRVLKAVQGRLGAVPRVRRGSRGLERSSAAGRPLVLANDRLDVALASGADGVHVGAEDLPPEAIRALDLPASFVVGLTCHTAEELRRAPGRGADYLGVGVFFPSPTKPGVLDDPRPALRALAHDYPMPFYAIGGLTLERAREVLSYPHVTGVVVSSAIQRAADPARVARSWRELLDAVETGG